MPNIFDFIPTDGAVAATNAPQQPQNIFDSIPATSNVFDGIPITSSNAQVEQAQFLANILHPPIINPALGIHQPGMFSSGFSVQPPSLQNADDWGFTATILPKVLNNAITRTIGTVLNASGQAIKGGVESDLFKMTGQPDLADQETIATIAKMFPQLGLQASAHGVDISDPYEDARLTLPTAERVASGIGPGLLQSAPQMALTAVQPELGAASFGLTPQGFDPVQAAAMMIGPAGGKMFGGLAENLAAKAGVSDAQALNVINRLGGGAGVTSLISTPAAYQIAQMKPGPERDEAIQDAASNAILTGILGDIGARDTLPQTSNAETADAPQKVVPENASVMSPSQAPVSEKIDNLAATLKNLQDTLRDKLPAQEQQTVNVPTDRAVEIIRNVFPAEQRLVEAADETSADRTSQPTRDATVPSAPVASEEPDFSPSGENDLTPNKSQQIIQKAINEKHAKAAKIPGVSEGRYRWNHDDVRIAESTFRRISQERPQIFGNTAHDADFYQTQIAQRLRALAKQHGTDVGFYKGDGTAPDGFYKAGRIWVRSNRTAPELIRSFEHEMTHHRDDGPIVSTLKNDVDLNSPVARKVLAPYNDYLLSRGEMPLSEDRARKEVVAPFLAGDTRFGDLSAAFNNPDTAIRLAKDYHVPGRSAGRVGGQSPGLSFDSGEVGETGRERAPPPVTKLAGGTSTNEVFSAGKVRIRSPRGDLLFIPQERLQSALSAGYKLAPTPTTNPVSARQSEQEAISKDGPQFSPGKSGRSNVTRLGIKRSNPADWRATRDIWDRIGYSRILSDANRSAIARGRTPVVDEAWISHFPEDAGLRGERITMHHIGGSPITVPLPATRHLNGHMPGGFRYNSGGPGSVFPVYSGPGL